MARMPRGLVPMLATPAKVLPKDEAGWAFEVKWDGVRGLTYIQDGQFHMESRNLKDFTPRYPEVWPLAEQLGGCDAILDGEVVAFDENGRPSFGVLQNRMHLANPVEVRQRMVDVPVLYLIFDLLWLDGASLMARPYSERRAVLDGLGAAAVTAALDARIGAEQHQAERSPAAPAAEQTGVGADRRRVCRQRHEQRELFHAHRRDAGANANVSLARSGAKS